MKCMIKKTEPISTTVKLGHTTVSGRIIYFLPLDDGLCNAMGLEENDLIEVTIRKIVMG